VHLLEEDVPESTFFDTLQVGNTRATEPIETTRDAAQAESAEVAA
jgi:hypothetical protein